jgi:UDP-N-acetylmuramyl pentapeptide phosphotransferase/UDP-N-acetylglucosamine-1-phosphate transferase
VPGELTTVLAAVICAACVTVAEPVLIPLLRRAAVDVPNGRSSHSVPTPRGGAPIVAGFADDLAGLLAGRRLVMQNLASLATMALPDPRSPRAMGLAA